MAGHQKFTAGKTIDVRQASREIEYAAAALTMKVMMVRFSRTLVDCGASRKLDRRQPALFHESFDVAVNRRDSQSLDLGLRSRQDLLWRERTIRAFKGVANGAALPGMALIFAGNLYARHLFNDSALSIDLHRNGSNVCISMFLGNGSSRPAALLCSAQSTISR